MPLDSLKDFKEQQQHGFSDSTPRAGSDRLQNWQKIGLVLNIQSSN